MKISMDASAAGPFLIGGITRVNRLGFGAMRVTGPGVWGPPQDEPEVLRTLRLTQELGINLIDTADSYGPEVSERLIKEALSPYKGQLIATKAGLTRAGPDQWASRGDPEYLIAQARRSRELLGVEKIGLWQLHRIDSRVPVLEQFQAVKQLLDEGVILHAGLSEVSVEQIQAALKVFPVATVQNQYNVLERSSEGVLRFCEAHSIGFIPWFPLGAGRLVGAVSVLRSIAAMHGVTPNQIALAWLLRRSPVMLPIPGTSKAAHLRENVAAASTTLTDDDVAKLDRVGGS